MKARLLVLAAASTLIALGGASMQPAAGQDATTLAGGSQDLFLMIPGIPGESDDAAHADEIDIDSYSWGLSNSGASQSGGGGGAGKVSVHDISFTMTTSKASPKLALACASGQHFPEAKLTVRKSGDRPVEYMIVTMTDVLVTSYSTGGSSGIPADSFGMNFAKIKIEYKEQKADGSLGETTTAEISTR